MAFRLGTLAERIGGTVEGDPDFRVESIATLETAGPADLAFLTSARYRRQAATSGAGALLVGPGRWSFEAHLLVSEEPYLALARLAELFHPVTPERPGVHPTAIVGEGCRLEPTVHVGAYAVLGDGCEIADGAVVSAHVVVGAGCRVGAGAVLHPHVVLYAGSVVGERSILHAGVVLGCDGFGYAQHEGSHHKILHGGRAVVEADVEIGANSTIDRAMLAETRVGRGTKIDNLVQVGHNVEVGRACLLISQAGVAGSTKLGDGVILAGQAGVAGHLQVGDGVRVAAKSAVFKSVPANRQVAGIPAVEAGIWRRQQASLRRLDDLRRRVAGLERRWGEGEHE